MHACIHSDLYLCIMSACCAQCVRAVFHPLVVSTTHRRSAPTAREMLLWVRTYVRIYARDKIQDIPLTRKRYKKDTLQKPRPLCEVDRRPHDMWDRHGEKRHPAPPPLRQCYRNKVYHHPPRLQNLMCHRHILACCVSGVHVFTKVRPRSPGQNGRKHA